MRMPSRDTRRGRLFVGAHRRSRVTWADLFERAERYDPTESDVTDTLRRHRADDADGEVAGR